jgi:uncharacterized coiled-coil protein SlyX
VTQLQLGNVTYNQQQLLSILHQPVRGNGLVSLAHQEIAAKLNIANGADGSCIEQTLAEVDALIGDLIIFRQWAVDTCDPVLTRVLSPFTTKAGYALHPATSTSLRHQAGHARPQRRAPDTMEIFRPRGSHHARAKSAVTDQEATISQLKSTVAKHETAGAEQEKEIKALTASLKEQRALIQKVTDEVDLNRSAPQTSPIISKRCEL